MPSGTVTPVGPISVARVSFTSAQLKATAITPATVVAAPGANKVLIPVYAVLAYTFVSSAYSVGTLSAGVANTSQAVVSIASFLDQASSQVAGVGAFYSQSDVFPRATFANEPIVMWIAAPTTGPILTSSIFDGGSGYAANDTGTVDDNGAGGSGGAYKVLTVDGGGAVLTYTITAAGTRYVATNAATHTGGGQPGTGTGFVLSIDSVTPTEPGDGTVAGSIFFSVVAV